MAYVATHTPVLKHCLTCGKKLRKEYSDSKRPGYRESGIFCTLTCGHEYGVIIAAHGLRTGAIKEES